jgi:signal transduction histidine kinase
VPYSGAPVTSVLTARPVAQLGEPATALHWTIDPLPTAAVAGAGASAAPPALPAPAPSVTARRAGMSDVEPLRRTFLSAMSHELLTPLAIIQGHAETLRYPAVRGDPAQVDRALDAIKDETARLRRLVQNVIDTARASAGALRIAPVPCSLQPILALGVRQFAGRSRRHRFVSEVPANLPLVLADAEGVESVLYNLLDNAMKYSPRGGEVRISATPGPENVEVAVEDQGMGIPPEERANVFEPYYRTEQQVRSPIQGNGLGLYLCKAVIDAHGGRIWAESPPAGGTGVHFTLPVA